VGLFKTGDTTDAAAVGPGDAIGLDCNGNGIDDPCDLSCDPPGCAVPGCGQSANCANNGQGEPMKQEVEPFHGALNPW